MCVSYVCIARVECCNRYIYNNLKEHVVIGLLIPPHCKEYYTVLYIVFQM